MKFAKAYVINWFGPFSSKEEVREWEKLHDYNFNLYILHGQKKYAKSKEHYYCGKTERTPSKRLSDADHHIKEIENRPHKIYIGCISNSEGVDSQNISLVENLIISYFAQDMGEDHMLNMTNLNFPPCNDEICIINKWYNCKTGKIFKHIRLNSPAHIIPAVIDYSYDSDLRKYILYYAQKLKPAW